VLKLVQQIVLGVVLLTIITSIEMVGSCASLDSLNISEFLFMIFNVKLSHSNTFGFISLLCCYFIALSCASCCFAL
jgi:hypothetical protein